MDDINKLILADLRENNWSIDSEDDAVYKVTPQEVTVGCAFGGGRSDELPIIRHQNESTGEWCEQCGYHHPNGMHEIPMAEAVETCKRIAENLPSEDAKARIRQRISKALTHG